MEIKIEADSQDKLKKPRSDDLTEIDSYLLEEPISHTNIQQSLDDEEIADEESPSNGNFSNAVVAVVSAKDFGSQKTFHI